MSKLRGIKRVQPKNAEVKALDEAVADFVAQLMTNPFIVGRAIDVVLSSGDTSTYEHGLGYKPTVIMPMYLTQTPAGLPVDVGSDERFLRLTCSSTKFVGKVWIA